MNTFINVETKEVVSIISDEGNFYILNNGMKIDKQLFKQKFAPMESSSIEPDIFLNESVTKTSTTKIEQKNLNSLSSTPVDPIDFLNSSVNSLSSINIEKLTKIDTSKYVDLPEDKRVIIKEYNQNVNDNVKITEREKKEILEKYKQSMSNKPNNNFNFDDDDNIKNNYKPKINENGLTEAQEFFRQQQIELTGVDPYEEKIKKYKESLNNQNVNNIQNNIDNQNNTINQKIEEDPSTAIFRRFKRNYDITIKFEIKDKISKPDFIKVMSEGFEGDIIQFYTDEIYKNFMSDVKTIKEDMYKQIYKEVYGHLPGEEYNDVVNEDKKETQKSNTLKKENKKRTSSKQTSNKKQKSSKSEDEQKNS